VLAGIGERRSEVSLLALALLLLTPGITVYVLDRGGAVYFLPDWAASRVRLAVFGPAGNHLPTFVHSPAFVLITAAVLRPWPRLLPAICATWFVIECLFELGQLATVGGRVAAILPAWFDDMPVLEITTNYFILGTFDVLDVASIGFGTVIAYPIVRCIQRGDQDDQINPQVSAMACSAALSRYRVGCTVDRRNRR